MGRGRAPCCDKSKVKSGAWSPEEDYRLVSFIHSHGHPNWRALPSQAGLLRCGKSCRLRWINYLRPNVKRGNFTREEEETVIKLHQSLGNKWSKIASSLPGRTDNEIKNVWNTHLKKRVMKNGKYHRDQEEEMNIDQSPASSDHHHHQQPSSSCSSFVSSSSSSIDQTVPKEASLSHSCSFSSSNSDVGPKDELVDHHHHQLKEWLRTLENELGLDHDQEQEEQEEEEEEKTFISSHVDDQDHDHDGGLVQVQVQQDQEMDKTLNDDEEEDFDIIIDHNLINISVSSWEMLFSSLPAHS